jgi:hypothetical protein
VVPSLAPSPCSGGQTRPTDSLRAKHFIGQCQTEHKKDARRRSSTTTPALGKQSQERERYEHTDTLDECKTGLLQTKETSEWLERPGIS